MEEQEGGFRQVRIDNGVQDEILRAGWADNDVEEEEMEEPEAADHGLDDDGRDREGEDLNDNDGLAVGMIEGEQPAPQIPPVCDPMNLTEEEHHWATNIKSAIEEIAELDSLSDFEYAQLALIEKDNVEGAIERAHGLQYFLEERKTANTIEHAEFHIRDTMRRFPGYFLSLSYSKLGGRYTLALDSTQVYAKELGPREALDNYLCAFYHVCHAMCPDFEAIRKGITLFLECQGFDWKKNFGLKQYRLSWQELGMVYPINFHQLKHFHTGTFINLIVSMARGFLPRDISKQYEVGCLSGMGRLDRIYLVPSIEAANERFIGALRELLQRRYLNEATFKL